MLHTVPAHRKEDAEKVFSEIRFDQISPEYITNTIIPNLVDGHNVCKGLVQQALNAESGEARNLLDFLARYKRFFISQPNPLT